MMNKTDTYKIKTALISVSDKTGIVDFAKQLVELGIEIYSTGGTEQALHNSKVPCKSITSLTGFPESFDGRVKTLHPAIHAGLLAELDNPDHLSQLDKFGFKSIDLLVVNLYPFEEKLSQKDIQQKELIENIDIGGPTMLRAAAKNYLWTAPIINPERYSQILEVLKDKHCTIPEALRFELAGEVFAETSYYDALIGDYFKKVNNIDSQKHFAIPMKLDQHLRYGENPHQSAWLYGNFTQICKQLHGKELSFNNIVDINAACNLIMEFDEPTAAIIKHTNPCGVGTAENVKDAYLKAFETDKESPFGGIIIVNQPFTLDLAEIINEIFTEVLIAPEFTPEALEFLKKKKNRRLMQVDFNKFKDANKIDIKTVANGFLLQTSDTKLIEGELKFVTKRKPTANEMQSMLFSFKVAKHVKSNSIVFTKYDRTLGIGAGQMSRVDSARIAAEKAKMMGLDLANSTVASDAFFPFEDGLIEVAKAGATAVIQPGGSVRDDDVIKAADENNIAMVFTGMRHFRH
jgi:phosphoribosylaminoimidazolecarboxamide formyltransferase/IMP cyclohydrolase